MRQPITLKIKFKSGSLDQFIERYSVDVSRGGIFIRTKEPRQVGTTLKFEFQLQDSSALISGEGTVVWIREHDPARSGVAPGMGVRFDKLATTSGQVLDQILAEKARRGEGAVESRFDAGVRASSSVAGTVQQPAGRRGMVPDFDPVDSKAMTPLPNPLPGLDGAEGEFGQESTRVMQDDVVQRLAQRTRAQEQREEESFSDEPTRARSAGEIEHLVKATSGPIAIGDEMLDRTNVDDKPRNKAPVIASSPPPRAAAPSDVTPPPVLLSEPPAPSPLPQVDSAESLTAADDEPTTALPLPSDPGEPTLREERPPERKKGSPLPAILGLGVIAACVIGYVVLSPKSGTETPVAKTPEPAATKTAEPTPPPEEVKPEAKTEAKTAPPEAPKGPSVDVTSEPPGANVFLDGKEHGQTPTTLADLEAKKTYEVRVAQKGYREWKTTLSPKAGAKVQAKLVPNEKVVEVSSTPAGADVFLDGRHVGRTPFSIRKLDVGKEHQVELRHGGFVTQARSVSPSDAWETKAEGRDVLALALTLEAEPPKVARGVPKRPAGRRPDGAPNAAEKPTATPDKPTEATEKPTATEMEKPAVEKPAEKTAEKPPAEKPAEKAAEKTAEKPAEKKEKPAEKPAEKKEKPAEGESIKTPAWMQKEKPAEGEAQ